MAWQIIQQPDGDYCIWSTVVEGFIVEDLNRRDLIEFYKFEFGKDRGEEAAKTVLEKMDRGEKPYHQFTKTYGQAKAWHDFRHNGVPLPADDVYKNL